MMLNFHRNHKAYYRLREGGGGGAEGVWRWGRKEIIQCHHQNDSCIKMGSDESHFNLSVIVRDKLVTRQCPQTTTVLKRKESRSGIELLGPSLAYQPIALTLGQTGSQTR